MSADSHHYQSYIATRPVRPRADVMHLAQRDFIPYQPAAAAPVESPYLISDSLIDGIGAVACDFQNKFQEILGAKPAAEHATVAHAVGDVATTEAAPVIDLSSELMLARRLAARNQFGQPGPDQIAA